MATLNINIASASETVEGLIEIATQAETDTGTDDLKALTPLKLEQSDLVQTDVAANTAKTTNATHTGEVSGSGVLTVDKTAISNKTLVTAAAGDHVLIGDATDSDNLKKVNVSDFLGGGIGTIMTFGNSVRFTPADNATYYFSQWVNPGGETLESFVRSYAPNAMTIKAATVSVVAGAGSSENVTFEIGVNGVYTAITTTAQLTSTATNFSNFALNITIAQGDSLTARMVTPTWVTNPTNMRFNLNFYAE